MSTFVIDTRGRPIIEKDPVAKLDYIFDWTAYLAGISDTIASVTFTLTSDKPNSTAQVVSSSNTATTATAWVGGGVIDELIQVDCKITTASTPARIDSRSIWIKIKDF